MIEAKVNNINRILIIGCSGGGKSTLTRLLSERFHLPAVHLDIHFWKPNWRETPPSEWREKVKELVKQEKWVMDGTFSESFDLRFPRADRIIILKLPKILCLYRAIARVFKYNEKERRPDMPNGCDESFSLDFYKYIWTFNKKVLPKIEAAIDEYECEDKTIYINSNKDLEEFIASLDKIS